MYTLEKLDVFKCNEWGVLSEYESLELALDALRNCKPQGRDIYRVKDPDTDKNYFNALWDQL